MLLLLHKSEYKVLFILSVAFIFRLYAKKKEVKLHRDLMNADS